MRTLRFSLLTGLLAAMAGAQQPSPAQGSPAQGSPAQGFVVHEWGTFTSMQGSDGIALEGLQHEEEGLPSFVHSLRTLRTLPPVGGSRPAVKLSAFGVTQKMETPVIYFHSEVPRRVSVRVIFQRGLMTQYYPIPDAIWPAPRELRGVPGRPLDLARIKLSLLQWRVDLIPYHEAPPSEIPAVDPRVPWAFARQVRAAYVRNVETKGRKTEAEHYLFYRGLGTFRLPLRLEARTGGRATLVHQGRHPLPFAVGLEMSQRGGRFRVLGQIPARGKVALGLARLPIDPDRAMVARRLGARVIEALMERGLFQDEARAMVATWSRQWFKSLGSRVIYILPREQVDHILPLEIRPGPEKIVRVLVGRLEFITPEREQEVVRALSDLGSRDEKARRDASRRLLELGRFLEPHLRRALARRIAPKVRNRAREMLDRLVR